MKTLRLDDLQSQADLNNINKLISKSKKIITLTGAGISCNAGIPDFRSANGLYNSINNKGSIKGKDLFDVSLFRKDSTIEIFCKFMENLYSKTCDAKPTKTHKFLSILRNEKKLIKCYTQNIDGLERQCGLKTGIEVNKWKELDVIQLHGDLNKLSCTNCFTKFDWSLTDKFSLRNGELPECSKCLNNFRTKENLGKRLASLSVGNLRPNIVLYGENHPYSETIAKGLSSDMNKNPNLLIIFGTSLKVDGIRKLVKNLSKKIHEKPDGLIVLINNCEIGKSYWENTIDYQIESDCDDWCDYVKSNLPNLFKSESDRLIENSMYVTPPSTPTKLNKHTAPITAPITAPNNSKPSNKNILNLLNNEVEIFKDAIELESPEFTPLKTMLKELDSLSSSLQAIAEKGKSPIKRQLEELSTNTLSSRSPSKRRRLSNYNFNDASQRKRID